MLLIAWNHVVVILSVIFIAICIFISHLSSIHVNRWMDLCFLWKNNVRDRKEVIEEDKLRLTRGVCFESGGWVCETTLQLIFPIRTRSMERDVEQWTSLLEWEKRVSEWVSLWVGRFVGRRVRVCVSFTYFVVYCYKKKPNKQNPRFQFPFPNEWTNQSINRLISQSVTKRNSFQRTIRNEEDQKSKKQRRIN